MMSNIILDPKAEIDKVDFFLDSNPALLAKDTIIGFLFENKGFMPDAFEKIYFKARQISERNAREVLFSDIDPDILESVFNSQEWQKSANEHLSIEKFVALLLASADRDPDTTYTLGRKARTWHCKKRYLDNSQLLVLSDCESISEITESHFRDLIHLCAIGKIETSADLKLHITENLRFLTRDNSQIYQIIDAKDLTLDEAAIWFLHHDVSFIYLEPFRQLHQKFKVEFWNWVNLKYYTQIKNPAKVFFNFYENILEGTYSFKELVERREFIERGGTLDGEFERRKHDYRDDLGDINLEILNFDKKKFRSREKTNMHHIFFPHSSYTEEHMAKFRGRFKIRMLVSRHEEMNAHFSKLWDTRRYEIPIPSENLQSVILAHYEPQEFDYLNFLTLRKIVCQYCVDMIESYSDDELSRDENFKNAREIYKFLKIQTEFVTPRTVSSL